MFEDTNHFADELGFAIDDNEGGSSFASTNDEVVEESNDDLGETKEKDSAEVIRAKTIASFQARLDSGEITLNQIPHAWIRKEMKMPELKIDQDQIEKIINEKLAEKLALQEDEQKFNQLNAQINSLNLSSVQLQELQAEYNDLRANGVKKSTALEKAIKMIGIESPEIRKMQEIRQSAFIPTGGSVKPSKANTEPWNDPDPAKRLAFYESKSK